MPISDTAVILISVLSSSDNNIFVLGFHGGESGGITAPKIAKRKAKNGTKGGNSPKQPKLSNVSCISAPNNVNIESGRLESGGPESGGEGMENTTLAVVNNVSDITQSINVGSQEAENSEMNSSCNNDFDDTVKIKIEPLSDTDTMGDVSKINMKTGPHIEQSLHLSQQCQGNEVGMSVTQSEHSFDMSCNLTSSLGAAQTIGPIRYGE